ncbi:MAG: competence/damage-inducible protein A, partial [Proteobacteria bacterium]|nr:competence/damage-inducible protein A [Pseudomonadota bacterium]
IAKRLNSLGVRLAEARVVADKEDAIVAAVNELRARHDYVMTTGGIGPTHDDITAAAIAAAFGRPLIRNPEIVAILEDAYRGSDMELNEARLSMADTPEGAILIDNPVSGAPGWQIENVFVFAGVPKIMQAMFESMIHRLTGGEPLTERSVVVDIGEGVLAAALADIQAAHPDLSIGSYPYYRGGAFGVKIVLRGTDEAELDACAETVAEALRALGGNPRIEDPAA